MHSSRPRLEPILDSNRFDNLIRHLVTGSSRRGIVRGLVALVVGGSVLGLLESEKSAARHHRHRRRRHHKRRRPPTPSPPSPPSATCPNSRPIVCDSGR